MKPFHWLEGATASISATTSSANVAIGKPPTGAFQIRVHNAGSSTAFIAKGTSSSVTAATTGLPVPSGAIEVLTLNNTEKSPITHMAAITATGTATVYFTTGAGI